MGVDREYRIRIGITADNSGAAQASEEMGKLTAKTEESSEAAEKHLLSHKAMRFGLHQLGPAATEAGHALSVGLANPAALAFTALTIGIGLLREYLTELDAEFKRVSEEAAKPLTNRLEAMRESTVALAVNQGQLAGKLREAANAEQSLGEMVTRVTAAMKDQAAAAESVRAASKADDLAQLEALHKAKLVSEEAYQAKKLAIELEYNQKTRKAEEQAIMDEIAVKADALGAAEKDQKGLIKEAVMADAHKVSALEDVNSQKSPQEVTAEKDKAAAALKEFEGKWSAQLRDLEIARNGGPLAAGISQELLDEYKLKIGDRDRTLQEWSEDPRRRAENQVAADNASRKADEAARKVIENEKFQTNTTREIADLQRRLVTKQGADAAVDQKENEAGRNRLKDTDTGRAVATGSEALERLMKGQKFDLTKPEDRDQLAQLDALAKILGGLPSHAPHQPEIPNRTGVGFGKAATQAGAIGEHDVLAKGKQVDAQAHAVNQELGSLLSGLHGNQARILQLIAGAHGNTQKLASQIETIKKEQEAIKHTMATFAH